MADRAELQAGFNDLVSATLEELRQKDEEIVTLRIQRDDALMLVDQLLDRLRGVVPEVPLTLERSPAPATASVPEAATVAPIRGPREIACRKCSQQFTQFRTERLCPDCFHKASIAKSEAQRERWARYRKDKTVVVARGLEVGIK